jgi:hypothetical protein
VTTKLTARILTVCIIVANATGVSAAQSDSCTSGELSQIKDPAVLATLPTKDALLQQALSNGGGPSGFDQMIDYMKQLYSQAESNLAIAQQEVDATSAGLSQPASPAECANLRTQGGTANAAARCQVLTFTDMLHFSRGYIEIIECLKRASQG